MASVREVLRAPGSPLEPSVRTLMEAGFGRDFGYVRLHTDDRAATSARALDARAYTVGSHIVFGKGHYNPGTREGLWLLAHELTHVIQQGSQSSLPPFAVADANDPLEWAADQAADLIAANGSLPPDFAFGAAPAGVIHRQVHPAQQRCGGEQVPIDHDGMLEAQDILWRAYLRREEVHVREDEVFHGGIYWDHNFQVPGGRRVNRYFATELLNTVRGWADDHRPDVIDFGNQQAYFFVPVVGVMADVGRGIRLFHDEVHRTERRLNMRVWTALLAQSNWHPPHVLQFPINPERFVCTEATDHNPPRGLILYDIRQEDTEEERQRRKRRVGNQHVTDADQAFAELSWDILSEMRNKITVYDPKYPDYVVIAPQEFYSAWGKRKAEERNNVIRDSYRLKPSYGDSPAGHYVRGVKQQLYYATLMIGGVSAGLVVVAASTVAAGVFASGVRASASAAAPPAAGGAGAAASAAAAPVVAAAEAAPAVAAAEAEVIDMFAWKAAREVTKKAVEPAVQNAAAAAGVLLLFGFVNDARADTPTITQFGAIRAVAVADFFKDLSGVPGATSAFGPRLPGRSIYSVTYTPEKAKGKFNLGMSVLFDGKPHRIIAQFTAK